MNLDKRLLKLLSGHKTLLLLLLFLQLITSAMIIGQAKALAHIINAVFLRNSTLMIVLPMLFLFLALSLVRAMSSWGAHTSATLLAAKTKENLRSKVANAIIKLGPAYTKSQRSGELTNTLLSGVDALDEYISKYLPQILLSVLIPLLILFFVFPSDLLSGFVLLLTAPLIPIFMVLIGNIAEALTKKQWHVLSKLSAHFLDILQGLTTLKIFGRSKDQVETIRNITNQFRRATMKVLRVAFLSALTLEMVATISTAIIAVEIGLRLLYAKIGFEEALFILILAPEFYQPLRQLGARFHSGMTGFTAAQRIYEIVETPAGPITGEKNVKVDFSHSVIRFENVTFTYADSAQPALKESSLEIKGGQRVAIVGPSGAGKTTLSFLLLRFVEPQGGTIHLNERPYSSIDPDELRSHIAWVPQRPYLFNMSIAENIRLANVNASDSEIIRAAQKANIHDFIKNLPQEYDTVVGERGARLSGGQAQRIALARAFLKDASLIILDEPTSNLDPEIERQIQLSIDELVKNKTVITIAHRLRTVMGADQIFVLDHGRIVEAGTHAVLLQQNGFYCRLLSHYGGAA